MLDQYIRGLVFKSNVQSKLDAHLEGLAKQASLEVETERFLKTVSFGELAKLAGIELPEDVCVGCGSQMEKLGSILQCHCGRVKKAAASCPGGKMRSKGKGRGLGVGKGKGPIGVPVGAKKVAAIVPIGTLAKGVGRAVGGFKQVLPNAPAIAQLRSKEAAQRGTLPNNKAASIAKFAQAMKACGGDADKALTLLEKEGYTKLAFSLGAAMPALKSVGTKALSIAKPAIGAVKGKAQQVAGTFQGARQGGAGIGKSLLQTAKAHPIVAAGTIGAAGLGAKAALSSGQPTGALVGGGIGGAKFTPKADKKHLPEKTSAVRLFAVGDAAGRMLAKVAEGAFMPNVTGQPALTPEEIQEAIQGAQSREDIEGRAQSWGRGGAIAGGVGGGALGAGAGFGLSRLLGAKAPLATGVGSLVGAGLGGMYGHRVGQAEGAEEAVADKLVSLLRARRAFGVGAGQGYMAGMNRGGDEFPRASEGGPQ